MIFKMCCHLLVLITWISTLFNVVAGGYPGVVDDEIWHHVLKVLSKEHGGSKIILGHPQPAHLVDAYTKVEYHEPYPHYGHGYHSGHYGHHHSHGHGGHYEGHHLHHGHHNHHHHHHSAPVYKVPAIVSSYGPPHHHHHGHYRK